MSLKYGMFHELPKFGRLLSQHALDDDETYCTYSFLPTLQLCAADIHTQFRETFPGGLFLHCKPRTADIAGLRGGECPSPQKMPPMDGFALSRRRHGWFHFSMFTPKALRVRYNGLLNLAAGSEQRKKKKK